ncbi:MAG: hypothetical protein Q9M50_05775 [Methylococcales bacterium]|nr:hypothetical protein [Methylococcales bacterium]
MKRFSSHRTVVVIVLMISLSSILTIALYFHSEDNSEPIVAEFPLPAHVNVLKKPTVSAALTALFAMEVANNKVNVNDQTLASFWFEHPFDDGLHKYHAIFIKNQMVDSETHDIYGSHADAPVISAVVYRLTGAQWVLVSKQKNIGSFGSWGDTPTIKRVNFLPLAKGNMALLLDISYSGQGYTNSGKTIFAYHEDAWAQLGYLQTDGDNSGVCDDETEEEDELLSACWLFKGKITLAEPIDNDDYPDVIVKRTGTMSDENGQIIPVKNSRYAFNGEEYLEISEMDD